MIPCQFRENVTEPYDGPPEGGESTKPPAIADSWIEWTPCDRQPRESPSRGQDIWLQSQIVEARERKVELRMRAEKMRSSFMRIAICGCVCAAIALVTGSPAPLNAQRAAAPDTVTNPMAGIPAAIPAGEALYEQTCEACHGANAQGGRGPNLATGNFRHGSSDADLFHTISTGVVGTEMPAFSALPAGSIWRIIAYLRSLSGLGGGANEVVPGNVAAGEKVFWGTAGCDSCHEVNGRGGIVGPDLSTAGMNTAAYLRGEILNPNSPPGRPGRRRRFFGGPSTVIVRTRDGKELHGLIRAQDSYRLIMTDVSGRLYRFDKKDLLAETVLQQSLMPADYGKTLSPDQLQNLIAYLKSLKQQDAARTAAAKLPGGLSFDELRNSRAEPGNWLSYWGGYNGHHFSLLNQITPENVKQLQAQWAVQMPGRSILEATPLVVNGIMYTTGQPGQVYAIDAKTGLVIWSYERAQKTTNPYESNVTNRGLAMLGDRLFFGTMDAALVALDARTGRKLWEAEVADTMKGYTITEAPLAIQGKVIVGVAGGEFGIRGFIDAYDAATGKRLWRFNTVPGPGEPEHETWTGDSWKQGGGPTWLTGSYDPGLNLLYWAVGNPGPDFNGDVRTGDNLYTDSLLALDPDTGKVKWYYQCTPGDTHDWDATEDMVLADRVENGRKQKLLLQADRNGMFYVLDRTNGRLLFAKPYVRVTWNRGFDKDGHPILLPGWRSAPNGNVVYPSVVGGANWQNPSYDAALSVLYVEAHDEGVDYHSQLQKYEAGRQYNAGAPSIVRTASDQSNVLAIDTNTGAILWKFPVPRMSLGSGVLATAGGVVFACTGGGNIIALDSKTGKSLWHFRAAAMLNSAPMSYSVDGKQYIAVSAGDVLYSFALPD